MSIFTPPKTLSQLGGQRAMQLVGQRCGINGEFGLVGGSSPFLFMHSRHLCPGGADAIQLVYSGSTLGPAENSIGPNPSSAASSTGPNVYSASGVAISGGTGYVAGEVLTFATTTSTAMAPVLVEIMTVSGGAPTSWQVIDGGMYATQLAAGVSQASTTGSGTGATATFTWRGHAMGLHVGIEPAWNTQSFQGPNSVEVASNGVTPLGALNWNLLIPMGDFFVTDLIPVDVPVGGAIGIRAVVGYKNIPMGRMTNGAYWRGGGSASANDEFGSVNATFYEVANTSSMGTSTANNLMQPLLILGLPKVQLPTIIAGFADSRCAGGASGTGSISNYDPLDIDGNHGWFEKALASTNTATFWPWANMARGSDRASYAIPSASTLKARNQRLRALALAKPTAVYVNLSINDFVAQETYATVLAYEQQLVAEIRGCGVKYVFTDTTDPNTTSTDSWATVANQTLSQNQSTNLMLRNAALRAGTYAAGYDFCVDQGPNVEDATGGPYTGKWKAGATGDGIHATPAALLLKAATAAAAIAAKISV